MIEIEEINGLWEKLIKQYRSKKPISFDFKSEVTKFLGKNSPNNYPHYIHYYPGRIFPYIPLFLFSSEEFCPHDGIILDPFSGSGTVLLESITNPVYKRSALGVEINPLGRLISKVKTTPLKIHSARDIFKRIISFYNNAPQNTSSFVPSFKNKSLWFSDKAAEKLSKLKYSINKVNTSQDYKDFFWVCFSSVVRKASKADPFIPPPVILKKYKYKDSPQKYGHIKDLLKNAENPDVLSLFSNIVEKNLKSMESLNNIQQISKNKPMVRIIWDDARDIRNSSLGERGVLIKNSDVKPLDSGSIDLIATSPPYLTAQKYIRTHKLELFWLDILKEGELLELDKMLIGTEKVSVKNINFEKQIGVKSIDSLIKWCKKISPERAASVYKYFEGMQKAISEIHRVLKKDRYAVLVVGNNTVLKRKVCTYKLLVDIGALTGFKEVLVLKDDIKGRGMITRRHNSGGLIMDEYIIILKKEMS